MVCEWLFSIKLWWAQVTVIPEASKIAVFNKGIWNGLNEIIPAGGHDIPNSIAEKGFYEKRLKKMKQKIKLLIK